jgi:hypothetical protein
MKRTLFLMLSIAAMLLVFAAPATQTTSARSSSNMPKDDDLRSAMRKLWDDHITYTRLFIVDAAAGLPEKDATTARLLQNQVDIGNAIKPYYGNAAGDQLTALLKEHITTAAEVVAAAKANDRPSSTMRTDVGSRTPTRSRHSSTKPTLRTGRRPRCAL